MELTREQIEIINSAGNIKINAVAGSGKTTTIIEYAKARPKNSRILYLAFNKSVRMEAIRKFAENGLSNVKIETAHSLAFKYVVYNNDYKVKALGYKTHEIAELLGLHVSGEKHAGHIAANHISKFIAYFCNSDKLKVQDLNYLDVVSDSKAIEFVSKFYDYIESQTRLLLGKMDKGEIDVTHDFYLKKFQLSNPKLPFDYILFDEGQDASPAMLDVFLKQKAVKVIVGDTHQQIYSWRFAVNSLEKVEFQTFQLSTSFRFSKDIAHLAAEVLKWKNYLHEFKPVSIFGKGASKEFKVKAILARTNLGLLLKAIEYVTEKKNIKRIYFEGNINSYTYGDDGASLYDVLNLYNGNVHLIKDKLIKEMKSLYELEDYIGKTEDVQLGMMIEIVKEYGNDIPAIIKKLKEKHVENDEKDKAEMIFSTVHRSKGMEYDAIQIVNDFISEEKLEKIKNEGKQEEINQSKLNEEINLLYVAITRTKNSIHIPQALIPRDFPQCPQVHIVKDESSDKKENKELPKFDKPKGKKPVPKDVEAYKAYLLEEIRKRKKNAYQPWTSELDDELTIMYCEGVNVKDMAKHFGRSKGAILARIEKLELEDLYG